VKRAALLVPLLAGACAATLTPTRDELARALREQGGLRVEALDLTHVACRPIDEEPTEFWCRWRQREAGRWRDWQATFARSGGGWTMIDGPFRRPISY
jgi:hypothetical protein